MPLPARTEFPRDQSESSFTDILRRAFRVSRSVLAVAVVDPFGECVDYCASVDPFEAKVAGAQLLVTLQDLADRFERMGGGVTFEVTIEGEERSFLIRRVDDDYILVAVVEPGEIQDALRHALARAAAAFRREAGLEAPAFEGLETVLRVETRDAVGWPYAPSAYSTEPSEWVHVAVVLGRWNDGDLGLACFRVRSETGDEITLAHDAELDRWTVLLDDRQFNEDGDVDELRD